jgi:Na+-transporting NADH:ubiquinone oxidoreductase subunit NqrE
MALPIPLEAPVTKAIFPVSNPMNPLIFDFAKNRNFSWDLDLGFLQFLDRWQKTAILDLIFSIFLRKRSKKIGTQN